MHYGLGFSANICNTCSCSNHNDHIYSAVSQSISKESKNRVGLFCSWIAFSHHHSISNIYGSTTILNSTLLLSIVGLLRRQV